MAEESGEERIDPIELFPVAMQERVRGLAWLGYLTREIKFCGHTFVLKTLRPQLKFAVAQAIQPLRNTLQEAEAYAAGHVAMALVAVDGEEGFCPQASANLDSFARARLAWLTDAETGFFQPTIEYLFVHFNQMEAEAAEAMLEFDRLSKGSQPTSGPWLGSSTAPEPSPDPTNSDIQP